MIEHAPKANNNNDACASETVFESLGYQTQVHFKIK